MIYINIYDKKGEEIKFGWFTFTRFHELFKADKASFVSDDITASEAFGR